MNIIFFRPFLRFAALFILMLCPLARCPAQDASSLLTPEKEQDLFNSLDLSSADLKPVADAIANGDDAKAKHALADYFRQRTSVPWMTDPRHVQRNPSYQNPVAEDAVKGRVVGGQVPAAHTFPDNKIDWLYNETLANPSLAKNAEWQWQLCRMGFWVDLSAAYRATGDEKYAHAWVEQLRSFIAQCPAPAQQPPPSDPSGWRTLEAGIRMAETWPTAYQGFLLSPEFTDDDLLLFLACCRDHAIYLKKFHGNGNRITTEMSGLYTVGALFPEFKDAQDWRTYALDTMHHEISVQYLPDGAQLELSPSYQVISIQAILAPVDRAKLVGRLDELPSDYVGLLEKAYDFMMYLAAPDRFLPKFNDSWPSSVVPLLAKAAQLFPDHADYKWFATGGKEGQPPAETSHAASWAGFYSMRSGWESDANYLVLRAGPIGFSHTHQDKLDVLVWAYGRELLYVSGGGTYEQSKWRAYAVDTFGHNTVLVDGKPQRVPWNPPWANVSKEAIDARWESNPDYDFAAGTYDGAYGDDGGHPASHTRRVLFVKPDLFVVADTLTPHDTGDHTYQARWNLETANTSTDAATSAVTTTDADLPNLAVVPLATAGLQVRAVSGQSDPEILGWNIRKDMRPERIPATTVLHTWHGSGVENFLTLLMPLRAGSLNPVSEVQPAGINSFLVTLSDGRKLTVTADPDPAGDLKVVETLPNGAPGRHVLTAARP